ncbi:MAG: DEAD/DEAH box helicase, partial [Rhodoferax sp.]|nr:DEAD/DEAH box helicase [Rhodoferax sp.]
AVALHGALSQGLRNRRLMALRQGQVQILVATDVAARGIDVPTISHVFNFGLPMKAEDYTHRIGRTGRAGRDGLAITFAEMRDRRKIFDIEAYTRQPIKAEVVPGLEPQQRQPDSRPASSFGGRGRFEGNGGGRDRKFAGSGPREGFSYERKGGFNDRFAQQGAPAPRADFAPRGDSRPPRGDFNAPRGDFAPRGDSRPPRGDFAPRGDAPRGDFAPRGDSRPLRGDFNAPRGDFAPRGDAPRGDFGPRKDFGAPRGDFGAPRGKPAFAKPGNGGKVFVPRDAKKRPARNFD